MKKKLTLIIAVFLCAVLAVSGAVLISRAVQSRRDAAAYDYAQLLLQQQELPPLSALPDIPQQPETEAPAEPAPQQPQQPSQSEHDFRPDTVPETSPEQEAPQEEILPPDTYALELLSWDISSLRQENEDVVGWIYIPGTPINYPVLQGDDNTYYLKYNWQKQRTRGGSIFMEHTAGADFSDFSTILYGHRMSDETMFNSLLKYESQEFFENHPRVYIRTENAVFVYDVFAAFKAEITDPVYWLQVENLSHRTSLIDFCLEKSAISAEVVPTQDDGILVLSTCVPSGSKEFRWVVTAVKTCALWTEAAAAE